jgi:outer membrane protein assembly factor BamA
MARKLVRRVVLGSAVLSGVLLIALAAIHLPVVRGLVLQRAQDYALRELGIVVGASSLHYALLARSIELRRVTLASAVGEPPFLQAEAVRFVLDRRIFRGHVAIDRLELVGPRLTLVRHANGTTNLPRALSASGDSTPLDLGVVAVSGLTMTLADESTGRAASLGPVDLSIDASPAASRPGAFGPSPFSVRLADREQVGIEPRASGQTGRDLTLSGTLAGRLGFDGVRVTVPELRVDTPEGRLALQGFVDVAGKDPQLNLQARLDADLARAARLIPDPTTVDSASIRGTVEVVATAGGAVASPTLHLAATGRGLAYGPLQGVWLGTELGLDGNRIRVHQLEVSSASGALHASGELAWPGAVAHGPPGSSRIEPSRLTVRWTDVDLDHALGSAGYALPTSLRTRASGQAELRLQQADASDGDLLSRLAADASVRLQPIRDPPQGRAGLALAGQARLMLKDRVWSIPHALTVGVSAASLAGRVTGRLRPEQNDSALGGSTRLRVGDLGEAVAVLRGAGLSIPEPYVRGLGGSLDARVEPIGTITRPTVRATLAARDVGTADWPGGTVDATLSADRELLRVHRLDARAAPARLTASGDYRWSGQGNVRFDAYVSEIGELARRFQTTALAMSGSAHLEGHASGTVAQPRAQATLTADNVAIEGTSIGRVGATIALAGARAAVTAEAPALAARVRADLDITSPYDYRAEAAFTRTPIPAFVPADLRKQLALGAGLITGHVRARGILSRPLESTGEADLDELELTLGDTRIKLERSATVAVTPDRITAEHVELGIGQTTRIHLSGTLAATAGAAPLSLRANGSLAELTAIAGPLLSPDARVSADGTVSLELFVAGTLRAPEPSGTLTLRAATVSYGSLAPATDVALTATVDRTRLVLQTLVATWQDAQLSARGALPLRLLSGEPGQARPWLAAWLAALPEEPRGASLTARVTNITPAVLRPFLTPDRVREIDGTMVLSITAEADALALERVRGSAVLDEAELTLAGVVLKQVVPTRLRLQRGYVWIDDLHWDSLGNSLRASGGTSITAEAPRVDLGIAGTLDLRLLGAFATGVASGGTAEADFIVSGSLRSPEVVGRIVVKNGELRLDSPRLVASELEGSVRVDKGRRATVSMAGTVNGGAAEVKGDIDLAAIGDPRGRVTLSARGVALEYPEGLQTESNANLTLTLGGAGPTLAGRIDVLGGSYREALLVSSRALSAWRQAGIASSPPSSRFLSRLRLDLALATVDAVRIDNNYGRLDLSAGLKIVGSLERPGVIGRVEAGPDGEIYLAGNTYRIERLIVDFANPRAIAPDLDFLANTRVGSSPIEVELQCTATGACERAVRSQAAGLTDEQAEADLFGIPKDPSAAGEQLARLLSGEVLGAVSRRIGLDTLRLEQGGSDDLFEDPTLIAGDVAPGSRLTLGKRLGDSVELVYSQNLAESGFTWSTTWFAPYGLSLRALLLDDQSRSYEFRHEPQFGASRRRRPPRPPGERIGAVRITGHPGFTERELRDRLKLTEGDRFQFAVWQRDRDRLAELYEKRGFLEARIRARRLPVAGAGVVDLDYAIESGLETRLDIRGATLPDTVRTRIVDRWSSTIFDGFLERDARTIVRDHLYREGYLQATVATTMTADAAKGSKTLTIDVTPGPVMPWRLEFGGNAKIPSSRLYEAARAVGTLTAWIDPASFEGAIERVYRDESLLAAEVDVPQPEVQNGTSIVCVAVREGEPYTVGQVALRGAGGLPEAEVRAALGVAPGGAYRPSALADGVDQIERRFRQAGFLEARVAADTKVSATAPRVDVDVLVQAGPRSMLRDVIVEGADAGKPLLARAITLSPGVPVDPEKLGDTRRRLYDTGLYRSVEIDLQPLGSPADAPTSTAVPTTASKPDQPEGDRPVAARIRLEERAGYSVRYGLAFNDDVLGPDMREQRFGFAADLEKRNLFSPGTTAGFSARLRRDLQVGRFYVGSERFFGLPLRSNVFVSRSRERPDSQDALAFVTDVTEIFGEQSYRLRKLVELRYGYGFGQNRTRIESADVDVKFKVARLTSSALIDRRQNPFDPSRGWFSAAGFELSRPGLGSDISFLKGFLQYYQFVPIGPQTIIATAARVGLARTFEGQDLVPSERFFAGGATTVRGYREDDLGPRSQIGDNEAGGGNGLLILNGEVRFPIRRWLRGVAFVDVGNVYPAVGDISFANIQAGVGAGLRFDTPVGILRVDLAAPVNRRAFDPRWTAYFGLGHAF